MSNLLGNVAKRCMSLNKVTQDFLKAKEWWAASAAQEFETSIENLKILEKEIKKNMTKKATKNTK